MGWRGHVNITRNDAIVEIFKIISSANDKKLEEILFSIQDDPLNYYEIVSEYDESEEEYKNYNHKGSL